jgi:alanyl-tRNA synthetase
MDINETIKAIESIEKKLKKFKKQLKKEKKAKNIFRLYEDKSIGFPYDKTKEVFEIIKNENN